MEKITSQNLELLNDENDDDVMMNFMLLCNLLEIHQKVDNNLLSIFVFI